jgi:hypothetical protein
VAITCSDFSQGLACSVDFRHPIDQCPADLERLRGFRRAYPCVTQVFTRQSDLETGIYCEPRRPAHHTLAAGTSTLSRGPIRPSALLPPRVLLPSRTIHNCLEFSADSNILQGKMETHHA